MSRFSYELFTRFHELGAQESLHNRGGQICYLSLEQQQQWLENIAGTHGAQNFPGTILPRLTEYNVVYYALAGSLREWRLLEPLVRAFAGPTTVREYPVDSLDPMDKELQTLGFAVIKKYSVPREKENQGLFENRKLQAIRAMNALALSVMNAPAVRVSSLRSLSELLDRFELALGLRDLQGCEDCLKELREANLLDHMNISFLRVRMFQRIEDWDGLVRWEFFERLCKTRRPGRISAILVKGLYHTELHGLDDDLDALVKRFQDVILPVSGTLFQELPSAADDEVLRTFAIHAATTGCKSHWPKLISIARDGGTSLFSKFWEACLRYAGGGVEPVPGVSEQVAPVLPSSVDLRNAIVLAYTEDCPEKARAAMELFGSLSEDKQAEALAVGRVNDMWHYLSTVLVGDWEQCFDILCAGEEDESALVLLDAFNQWSADDQLTGSKNAKRFLALLEKVSGDATGVRRLVANLQSLVGWVKEDAGFPREEGVPVYVFLLELYALSEHRTPQRLESFSELLENTLVCAMDTVMYERVLESAGILVEGNQAHKSVDWMIDLVGIVLDNHSPSPDRRGELLWSVLHSIRRLGVKLTKWQSEALRVLLRALQQDVGAFDDLPVEGGVSPLTLCAHKSVCIYTLEENSGNRAREIIEAVCPSAIVSVLSDKDGSVGLKHQARSADIFVMVWRAAKHAATIDIKQNRPKEKPLLQPVGKGSSSILRELENFFRAS